MRGGRRPTNTTDAQSNKSFDCETYAIVGVGRDFVGLWIIETHTIVEGHILARYSIKLRDLSLYECLYSTAGDIKVQAN